MNKLSNKKTDRERGITLIALVITIIVLLILAGVSIATLTGPNGLLSQTQEAKTQTNKVGILERIQIEVIGSYSVNGKIDESKLRENLKNIDGIKVGQSSFPIDVELNEHTFRILETGKIEEGGTISYDPTRTIDVKDYGAVVTNYKVNDMKYEDDKIKWKIFLEDGKDIYLIASNYIKRENLPKKDGIKLNDGDTPKAAYFNSILEEGLYENGVADILKNTKLLPTFETYHKWLNINRDKKYNNTRAVAYILDTEIWKVYAGDQADYAIGGPTIEMFVSSYNKTHNGEKIIELSENYEYGYKFKWSGDENFSHTMQGIDMNDSLYVINDINDAKGMRIASTSGYEGSENTLVVIPSNGFIHSNFSYDKETGFRPIVCLSPEVKLQKQIDGTFEIVK